MRKRLLATGTLLGAMVAFSSSANAAAVLNDAVVLWNFDSLNDANGANSVLTIVDKADGATGTTGVNIDGFGFWNDEGPGSDDRYSNLRTGSDRVGTWFDAGQGAGNELQITGAHTMVWRGEFKDVSITGYLWSKYDHNVGPNGLKNRGAYLRYNPGGSLTYLIDDGDGGAAAVSVDLPAGTVGTGGVKYEIVSVFDPVNDTASIIGLNPKTRAVLFSQTSAVTFDTIDLDHPVPFNLGDRLAWSGSDWESSGGSGARVDVEMFAVFDQAFSQQEIIDMTVPEPASLALMGIGCGVLAMRKRR